MAFRRLNATLLSRFSPGPVRAASVIVVATMAALVLAGSIGPLAAQTATLSPDEAQQRLAARKQSLEQAEQRAKALQSDLALLADEREKLNARLLETARLIQRSEAQLTETESRLGELDAQEKIVRGSLEQRYEQIAKLLSAMQRMGRNPPPVIITKREDALEMVRSAMLLARAFPELKTQAEDLSSRLGDLVRVGNEIRTEGDKLRTETQRLRDSRTRLAALMESKKQSVAERQKDLEDLRRTALKLAQGVNDLSQLIPQLDRLVGERTELGRYDAETRTAAVAPVPPPVAPPAVIPPGGLPPPPAAVPPAPAPPTAPPVAKSPVPPAKPAAPLPGRPAIELTPSGPLAANLGRLKPSIPFEQAKKQLPLPAQGRRVLSYGDKTQYNRKSEGLVVETRNAAQIVSPTDGWVVYAGPFRSLGQLLIINAGSGYHILLAGMSQIDVQLGQFVLAAEPIGTMASAPKGASQQSAPVLYVEFRKDGRPVDPEPWWAGDVKKVE